MAKISRCFKLATWEELLAPFLVISRLRRISIELLITRADLQSRLIVGHL
jgi:hypothetical protein